MEVHGPVLLTWTDVVHFQARSHRTGLFLEIWTRYGAWGVMPVGIVDWPMHLVTSGPFQAGGSERVWVRLTIVRSSGHGQRGAIQTSSNIHVIYVADADFAYRSKPQRKGPREKAEGWRRGYRRRSHTGLHSDCNSSTASQPRDL